MEKSQLKNPPGRSDLIEMIKWLNKKVSQFSVYAAWIFDSSLVEAFQNVHSFLKIFDFKVFVI